MSDMLHLVSEPTRVTVRDDIAGLVDLTAQRILDLAGEAAFDALEGAFLSRDRPELTASEDIGWTLAMIFSTSLLFPVLEALDNGEADVRRPVSADVAERVGTLVIDGVVELRVLIRRHLADALAIVHGPTLRADYEPGPGEELDALIGIYASYELDQS